MDIESQKLNKIIEDQFKRLMPIYLRNQAFTTRKVTDTPTDNLTVVNMKYVNQYGSTISRPSHSVIGEQYFDTDLGYPIFKNTNGKWINSTGSILG